MSSGDPAHFYERHVFMCTNERAADHPRGCCKAGNSVTGRAYLKDRTKEAGLAGRMRINTSGCLDRCELGPVMVIYPEGVWYRYDSKADLDEIFETHVVNGGRVPRLMLSPDDR